MGQRTSTRRPNGSGEFPVRSVRVSDEVWEKAKRRATFEGVTMSRVLAVVVEGYADGYIDLPTVKMVYPTPKVPSEAPAAT